MRVSRHGDDFTYHEGDYSLDVYKDGDVYLKHNCPASSPEDNCYDHILPYELKESECRYCTKLDVPENLQALYYLMKWER